MKMDNIIKSILMALFLIGMSGIHAKAGKGKEDSCHTLTVDNIKSSYDIQLNYAPCGNPFSPQYLTVLHGKTSTPVKVANETGFVVGKCNINGKCDWSAKTTAILPLDSTHLPSIETDYAITCSGTYEKPTCTSRPPYKENN